MGDYTTTLKFYKPDGDEFIDPETQLNRNWDIADTIVRRNLEYEYSSLPVVPTQDTLSRSRFYKAYSNSVTSFWRSNPSFFYQDPAAFVSTWESGKNWFFTGWFDHPSFPLFARIVKSTGTTTEVEWSGSFWQNGATIPVNTNMTVIDNGGIPSQFRPVRAQYFTANAGNTSSNYSMARVFISELGKIEIKRYGSNPAAGTEENRIDLSGIKYNVEVTG